MICPVLVMLSDSCDPGSFRHGCAGLSSANGNFNQSDRLRQLLLYGLYRQDRSLHRRMAKNVVLPGCDQYRISRQRRSAEKVPAISLMRSSEPLSTLLFVDPVMGDSGVKYDIFTPRLQQQMQKLVSHADVITPNLTELCLLTHSDFAGLTKYKDEPDYLDRIARIAAPLKETQIQTIIVTGILYQAPSDDTVKYYNLVLENDQISVISSGIHGGSYSGTGDLLSAVVCASMVQGKSAAAGVEKACRFIERSLIDTVATRFRAMMESILNPIFLCCLTDIYKINKTQGGNYHVIYNH